MAKDYEILTGTSFTRFTRMRLISSWTEDQAKFFLDNGYVVIKQAFTKENAEEWSKNLWVRLDIDPTDKSTWARERIHMPWHKRVPVVNIAPKVRTASRLLPITHQVVNRLGLR